MRKEIDIPSGKTGKVRVVFDDAAKTTCRGCGAVIIWGKVGKSEKTMPLSVRTDGSYISHFADCPKGYIFRK